MNNRYSSRVQNLRPSAIRALAHFIHRPGMISFAGGSPAPESFPVEQLIRANRRVLSARGGEALQYSTTEGLDELREIIIDHMTKAGIPGLTLENVLVTNGSQQGLDFLGRLFLDEDDVVICEDPSYLGAINAFAAYGPKFVGIPMDEEGMCIDLLEQALQNYQNAKFIYTIPTFQNPTGRTMGQERRKEVLNLAVRYQVPLIEDDPYSDLYFEGERPLPVKHYDTSNDVIYLGTFSKTFCPGLRIGWIAGDPDMISKFAIIKQSTDLHTSTLPQMELAEFIHSSDWNAHVAAVREIYRSKRDVMMKGIAQCFPSCVRCTFPGGGLFTWAELPEGTCAEDILEKCIAENVAFVPGSPFYASGGHHNYMRMSYGMSTEEQIRNGVERLGHVLQQVCGA